MRFYIWIRDFCIVMALSLFGLLIVASYVFDFTDTQITIGLAVLCGLAWLADRFLISPTR